MHVLDTFVSISRSPTQKTFSVHKGREGSPAVPPYLRPGQPVRHQ